MGCGRMGRRLLHACAALAAAGCGVGGSMDAQSGSAGGVSDPYFQEHPIVCDAPMCDADSQGSALSVPGAIPTIEMRRTSVDTLRHELAERLQRGDPALALVARWAAGRAPLAVSAAARAWLVEMLDREVVGWRALAERPPEGLAADADETKPGAGTGPLDTAGRALETSGCGEMRLVLALTSVRVLERDDNFTDDRPYCIVRAVDGAGELELVHTDVAGPLGPGERHDFDDGVYFGRGGARDPGDRLEVSYDCWEMDDASEYQRFEELIDQVRRYAKYIPSAEVQGVVVAAADVAHVLVILGKLFDGDDHLFQSEENFERQDLWRLIAEQSTRTFGARGNHLGSDWSWELGLSASGCAVGADAASGGYVPPETTSPGGGCDGCFVGSSCRPGTENDACGLGGVDCRSCGGFETCGAGACAFDNQRTVDVTVQAVDVPDAEDDGSCWDIGCSAPDVYVTLAAGGKSGSTSAQESFSPRWSSTILRDVAIGSLMSGLRVTIYDDDAEFDDTIDSCRIAVGRAELEDGSASYRCGQSVIGLRFR